MIAPRSWYPKPCRASSLARAIAPLAPARSCHRGGLGVVASPPAMRGWRPPAQGWGYRLLSVGRACFNARTPIRTPEYPQRRNSMDLGMTAKVKPLVEKVRAMVREEIMPLEAEYEAEVGKGGNRWSLHQAPGGDPRRPQGQGARARPVEFLADRERQGLRPDHRRIRLSRRGDGLVAAGAGDLQLLRPRHRQHGGARALRLRRAQGEVAEAPAGGQDPLRLHHDRAGCRLLRRHQHRAGRQARRRRMGAQRREMVRLRRRRSALQDLHRHGLHRCRRRTSTSATR